MAKYKVIATFVFEDVEADSPEEAQAWVDGTSFHSYIEHPKKDDRVNPSYEVEEEAQVVCSGCGAPVVDGRVTTHFHFCIVEYTSNL